MLHIVIEDNDLPEWREFIQRAAGTWDPNAQPKWLQLLADMVDTRFDMVNGTNVRVPSPVSRDR